jgi:arabinogalactan endo-1,4-beta-galactosidase
VSPSLAGARGRRRTAWQAVGATLPVVLLAALACRSSGEPGADGPDAVPALRGADISALERIEQAGGVFRDAGRAGDAIAILRSRGANLFRLRLFVSPDHTEVQVNDLDYTLRLAARVKAAGARLLLDLHYSDTWADPGHQTTPAAWAALDIDSLERRVEAYTDSVVTRLKQAGALPDIVQVGNEVDSGFLWPLGQVGGGSDSLQQWSRFTRLLKAGIRGVRGALGPGDSVRILLHFSLGGDVAATQWFFDHVESSAVPYDVIGLSYYPWWHGTLAALQANLQTAATRYGREVMVVEASYPWRAGGWENGATNLAAMTWGVSPQGQARFLRDVLGAVATVPSGRGLGVVWWYPEAIAVPGLFVWGGGSLALFDPGGDVLPAAATFGGN